MTTLWPVVILVVVGCLNAGCGYLIWRRKVYGLIAGYDARNPPADPERLARWIGVWSIGVGLWSVASAIAIALHPTHASAIIRVMALGIVLAVSIAVVGGLRRAR